MSLEVGNVTASGKHLATTVGSITTGGNAYQPWPTYWPQNSYYISNWPVVTDDYANEVEVDRGEHDAVLRFYRRRGNSRSMVKEITVPVGVLDWLTSAE